MVLLDYALYYICVTSAPENQTRMHLAVHVAQGGSAGTVNTAKFLETDNPACKVEHALLVSFEAPLCQ